LPDARNVHGSQLVAAQALETRAQPELFKSSTSFFWALCSA
jgi:hypothetical protein